MFNLLGALQIPAILGGGLIEQALHLCGYAFLVCLFLPKARVLFDLADKARASLFPASQVAPSPTADEIAAAVAKALNPIPVK